MMADVVGHNKLIRSNEL